MTGTLNEAQINNLLLSQVVGRIACTHGKQPYIVPVTYVFDGRFIYGQSHEGKKLETMRKNNAVCFQVDQMINMANWQSVIIYGTFEELKGKASEKAREYLFEHVMPLMTSSTVHTYGHSGESQVNDDSRIKPIMYRIKIKEKTGRFEKQ